MPDASRAVTGPDAPSRHDGVTINCLACGRSLVPTGRQRYCDDACRARAYRRRQQTSPATPRPAPLPTGAGRRAVTVYECEGCGHRSLGEQRCEACNTWMRRVGTGGLCPCCQEPITLEEVIADREN